MNTKHLLAGAAIAAAIAAWSVLSPTPGPTGTGSAPDGSALAQVTVPPTLSAQAQMGQPAFESVCAACHGRNAAGRNGMGPPLIHRIYEPSHHGDESFHRAVALGVTAHHWRFGDMPPQEGLTRADVDTIIAYVRELQRANGIN